MSGKMLQFVNQAKAMPKSGRHRTVLVTLTRFTLTLTLPVQKNKPADVRNVAYPSVR